MTHKKYLKRTQMFDLILVQVALNFMDPLGKTPKRKIAESYIHMDFNPKNFLADIAMLKVSCAYFPLLAEPLFLSRKLNSYHYVNA